MPASNATNTMQYRLFLLFCILFLAQTGFSQNTIGGVVKLIPEVEVDRQSDFVLAEREFILERWGPATELYKKFTYENPNNDAGWYGLARCYAAVSDYINGLDAISKAVLKSPENDWYALFQIDLFEKTGRFKDAVKSMEAIVKKHPGTPDYWRKLAYLALLNEDPKQALRSLDKLEALTGITEETAEKKTVIYEGMGDVKKAGIELQRLADAYPNTLDYRRNLAAFYEEKGDLVNAQKTYQEILRRNPNDQHVKIALIGQEKRSSDAVFLNSLLPIVSNPQVPIDAKLKELVPYLAKLKDPNTTSGLVQPMTDLGKALTTTHPNDPKSFSFLGAVYYLSNQTNAALEAYRICIRLNPNVFGAWENTLSILEELKLYDEMLQVGEQAIDAFPNQPRAYLYYGLAAIAKGKYDDAATQLEQAKLMSGNSPVGIDIQDQLALIALLKKDFNAATAQYDQILKAGGDKNASVLEHYGDLLAAKGKNADAVPFWQKAYDLGKNPALLQKIKGQ